MATNYLTGQEYSGKNNEILSMVGLSYPTSEWVTFLQAQELGGTVKKGEHGVKIIKIIEDKDKREIGLRSYTVFNIAQCDNLDADLKLTPDQYEVYKALKKDKSELTRKKLAKVAELI